MGADYEDPAKIADDISLRVEPVQPLSPASLPTTAPTQTEPTNIEIGYTTKKSEYRSTALVPLSWTYFYLLAFLLLIVPVVFYFVAVAVSVKH